MAAAGLNWSKEIDSYIYTHIPRVQAGEISYLKFYENLFILHPELKIKQVDPKFEPTLLARYQHIVNIKKVSCTHIADQAQSLMAKQLLRAGCSLPHSNGTNSDILLRNEDAVKPSNPAVMMLQTIIKNRSAAAANLKFTDN
ncbi:MAG: hypothetical protein P0S95_01510 [Rhabdochlamydiaceae bacterium]|nr:hypothetical protein [Candidatus Amphrikana amoebophyrae]